MKSLQDCSEQELQDLVNKLSSTVDKSSRTATVDIFKTVLFHEKEHDGSFSTAQIVLSSLADGIVPNRLDYVELANRISGFPKNIYRLQHIRRTI